MVEYIKQLIQSIDQKRNSVRPGGVFTILGNSGPPTYQLLRGLSEELDRLDPRDFEPAAQHDFVVARIAVRLEAFNVSPDPGTVGNLISPLPNLLDAYGGQGSRALTRDFSFVTDQDVRRIVERDYRELTMRAFPDGAWKSTVILAGSILEAVLYDRLTKDPATSAKANASRKAPRGKDITKHDFANEWKLNDMIKVACDLGFVPPKYEQTVHEVLRDYRNFVHPRVEIKRQIPINEGHATASKGMLLVILDELK